MTKNKGVKNARMIFMIYAANMKSTGRYLLAFKSKGSIISLIILQFALISHQIDFDKNRLSVLDCLNAVKREGQLSLSNNDINIEGVINYRAKYILNELLISNRWNITTSKIFDTFYPYHRHKYAVQHTLFTLPPELSVTIMIITTNCQTNITDQFKILLTNHIVHCQSLNTTAFHPLKIFKLFSALNVRIAVLILPRLLVQAFLEISALLQIDGFFYVTIDYELEMIRYIHHVNPLLKFFNSNLVNASDLSQNEMKQKINQTECSLSLGKESYHDNHEILVCQHQIPRNIKIVTVFFVEHVFEIPNVYPHGNKCELGLPCEMKSFDTTKEWKWICCGGKMIDKLIIIMNHIKIPFSIYVVEDGRFGSLTNGTWDGLVFDLLTGKADIAVAGMAVTTERFKAIDFVYERSKRTPIAILLRKPDVDLKNMNFSFIPKNGQGLIVFLVLLHLSVFFVVYIFECIAHRQNFGQKYNFKDSWSFVGAIIFQRDLGGLATVGWAGRTLAITYACGMTFLISTYTATLTAENISLEDIPEFKGLRDKMFQDPLKRVGLSRYGSHENMVDRYHHKSQRFDVIRYETAAKQLVDGKLDAIIGSIGDLERALVSETDYCKDLIIHVDESESEDLAWGYQKNSKFGDLISLSVQRLIKTKSLQAIEEKWSAVNSCRQQIRTKRYPWQFAGGLIICLLVTVGACVVIVVLETIFISLKRKKTRSYPVSNH